MTVYDQSKIFCIFFVIGILIGFIFDIFRSIRKTFKSTDLIVGIQDVTFLLLVRRVNP